MTFNLTRVKDAQTAIEFLIDQGGFTPHSKRQFAIQMDWYCSDRKTPDRRRVEEVCNLTRDQEQWPEVSAILGGFVIAYSPTEGGMSLADLNGTLPLDFMWHKLRGDLRAQQQSRTQNQRRLPMWKAAGVQAANQGDTEMARYCWQAESEISKTGFVTGSLLGDLMKALATRGIDGQ